MFLRVADPRSVYDEAAAHFESGPDPFALLPQRLGKNETGAEVVLGSVTVRARRSCHKAGKILLSDLLVNPALINLRAQFMHTNLKGRLRLKVCSHEMLAGNLHRLLRFAVRRCVHE